VSSRDGADAFVPVLATDDDARDDARDDAPAEFGSPVALRAAMSCAPVICQRRV
jgi:hypothetical protein